MGKKRKPLFATIWLKRYAQEKRLGSFGLVGREEMHGAPLARRCAYARVVSLVIGTSVPRNLQTFKFYVALAMPGCARCMAYSYWADPDSRNEITAAVFPTQER